MSESKHTPGPWTIERCSIDLPENDRLIVGHPNSSDMSVIRTIGRLFSYARPEVNKANARLIAAAPELLEACKELLAGIGMAAIDDEPLRPNDPEVRAARAAIAKCEKPCT